MAVKRIIDKYFNVKIKFLENYICERDKNYYRVPKSSEDIPEARFHRSNTDQVVIRHHRIFALLTQAKMFNELPTDVRLIDFTTEVVGETSIIEYGGGTVECFPTGSSLWLRFGLPNSITDNEMTVLTVKAGEIGLSGKAVEGYRGLFEIEEVSVECLDKPEPPTYKSTRQDQESQQSGETQ